jgi:hypothetical protein
MSLVPNFISSLGRRNNNKCTFLSFSGFSRLFFIISTLLLGVLTIISEMAITSRDFLKLKSILFFFCFLVFQLNLPVKLIKFNKWGDPLNIVFGWFQFKRWFGALNGMMEALRKLSLVLSNSCFCLLWEQNRVLLILIVIWIHFQFLNPKHNFFRFIRIRKLLFKIRVKLLKPTITIKNGFVLWDEPGTQLRRISTRIRLQKENFFSWRKGIELKLSFNMISKVTTFCLGSWIHVRFLYLII